MKGTNAPFLPRNGPLLLNKYQSGVRFGLGGDNDLSNQYYSCGATWLIARTTSYCGNLEFFPLPPSSWGPCNILVPFLDPTLMGPNSQIFCGTIFFCTLVIRSALQLFRFPGCLGTEGDPQVRHRISPVRPGGPQRYPH